MILKKTILSLALFSLSFASISSAHPGRTDSKVVILAGQIVQNGV
ncbi:hypothetical protein ACFQ88_23235 [Paenibacillus sp. NPDC056579]